MQIFHDVEELCNKTFGALQIYPDEASIYVLNRDRLWTDNIIDSLVYTAAMAPSEELRTFSRWVILEAGKQTGNAPASIRSVYGMKKDNAEIIAKNTIPAVNLEGMTYELARGVFRAKRHMRPGPIVFETVLKNQEDHESSFAEYAACIIAAAIKEQSSEGGWGPVFLQGTIQVNAGQFTNDLDAEIQNVTALVDQAIAAGIYNIDLDLSALDEQLSTSKKVQIISQLLDYIRSNQPKKITVTAGVTAERELPSPKQLRAFLKKLQQEPDDESTVEVEELPNLNGLSKIGLYPEGLNELKEEGFPSAFSDLLQTITDDFGLMVSIHLDSFDNSEYIVLNLPSTGIYELHLMTRFQQLIFHHPHFPGDLHSKMIKYLETNYSGERKAGWSEKQFFHAMAEELYAPFKKQLWNLEPQITARIRNDLERYFTNVFETLGISNSTVLQSTSHK